MTNKKKHITKEERFCIEKMLCVGTTQRKIAHTLGRGVSTISEEISRCSGIYSAEKAHRSAYLKQYRKKRDCMKVSLDPLLSHYVEKRLRTYWSPERISGRLKKQYGSCVSAKAIRKFAHRRGLESFLYRKGKIKKQGNASVTQWSDNRIFIDDSRCVRTGYGHWEGDFIVSSKSTAVLFVAVERVTKMSVVRWLSNRNNDLVRKVIVEALSPFSVKSLTVDNDVAFLKHGELSSSLHVPVYFARPFRSTDKALVENTNRWIRWFIPKKKDLRGVQDCVEWIEEWLNSVPKQCLEFSTAREMVVLEELRVRCSY